MTLTLALDTATDLASVAVGDGPDLRAELLIAGRRHAAALLPAIEQVLAAAGAGLGEVERVLLADGPGSFTGLRIGAATVQGLLHGRDGVAVATAPSLAAAAWMGAQVAEGPVAALYDALRGEVYGAVYEFTADAVSAVVAPGVTTIERLAREAPGVTLVVTDGADADAGAIRRWSGRGPLAPPAGGPRAAALLRLAALTGGVRPVAEVASFEPTYGRPAEAQARWEREHGRPLPDSRGHRV